MLSFSKGHLKLHTHTHTHSTVQLKPCTKKQETRNKFSTKRQFPSNTLWKWTFTHSQAGEITHQNTEWEKERTAS